MANLQDLFNDLQADPRVKTPQTFEEFSSKMETPEYAEKIDGILNRLGYDSNEYEGLKKKEESMVESAPLSQSGSEQPIETTDPIQEVGTEDVAPTSLDTQFLNQQMPTVSTVAPKMFSPLVKPKTQEEQVQEATSSTINPTEQPETVGSKILSLKDKAVSHFTDFMGKILPQDAATAEVDFEEEEDDIVSLEGETDKDKPKERKPKKKEVRTMAEQLYYDQSKANYETQQALVGNTQLLGYFEPGDGTYEMIFTNTLPGYAKDRANITAGVIGDATYQGFIAKEYTPVVDQPAALQYKSKEKWDDLQKAVITKENYDGSTGVTWQENHANHLSKVTEKDVSYTTSTLEVVPTDQEGKQEKRRWENFQMKTKEWKEKTAAAMDASRKDKEEYEIAKKTIESTTYIDGLNEQFRNSGLESSALLETINQNSSDQDKLNFSNLAMDHGLNENIVIQIIKDKYLGDYSPEIAVEGSPRFLNIQVDPNDPEYANKIDQAKTEKAKSLYYEMKRDAKYFLAEQYIKNQIALGNKAYSYEFLDRLKQAKERRLDEFTPYDFDGGNYIYSVNQLPIDKANATWASTLFKMANQDYISRPLSQAKVASDNLRNKGVTQTSRVLNYRMGKLQKDIEGVKQKVGIQDEKFYADLSKQLVSAKKAVDAIDVEIKEKNSVTQTQLDQLSTASSQLETNLNQYFEKKEGDEGALYYREGVNPQEADAILQQYNNIQKKIKAVVNKLNNTPQEDDIPLDMSDPQIQAILQADEETKKVVGKRGELTKQFEPLSAEVSKLDDFEKQAAPYLSEAANINSQFQGMSADPDVIALQNLTPILNDIEISNAENQSKIDPETGMYKLDYGVNQATREYRIGADGQLTNGNTDFSGIDAYNEADQKKLQYDAEHTGWWENLAKSTGYGLTGSAMSINRAVTQLLMMPFRMAEDEGNWSALDNQMEWYDQRSKDNAVVQNNPYDEDYGANDWTSNIMGVAPDLLAVYFTGGISTSLVSGIAKGAGKAVLKKIAVAPSTLYFTARSQGQLQKELEDAGYNPLEATMGSAVISHVVAMSEFLFAELPNVSRLTLRRGVNTIVKRGIAKGLTTAEIAKQVSANLFTKMGRAGLTIGGQAFKEAVPEEGLQTAEEQLGMTILGTRQGMSLIDAKTGQYTPYSKELFKAMATGAVVGGGMATLSTAQNAYTEIKNKEALKAVQLSIGENFTDIVKAGVEADENFKETTNYKFIENVKKKFDELSLDPNFGTFNDAGRGALLDLTLKQEELVKADKAFQTIGVNNIKLQTQIKNVTAALNKTLEKAQQEATEREKLNTELEELGVTDYQVTPAGDMIAVNWDERTTGEEMKPNFEKAQSLVKTFYTNLSKNETNAVQEQTTSEVPVQSETTDGQQMAKGESKTELQATPQEGREKGQIDLDIEEVQKATGAVINLNEDGTLTITPPKRGGQSKKAAAIETATQQLANLGYNVESRLIEPVQQESAAEEETQQGPTDEEFGNAVQESENLGIVAGTEAMNTLAQENKKDANKSKILTQANRAVKAINSLFPNVKIVLHNDDTSYNQAMEKLGGTQNTRGQFVYKPSADGNMQGAIHINLNRANTRTIAHEVSHAALLKMFKGDGKLFNKFKETISQLAKDKQITLYENGKEEKTSWGAVSERLSRKYTNEKGFTDEDRAEEYLAELAGLVASLDLNKDENKTLLKMIADFINKFLFGNSELEQLGLKPISDTSSAEEVLEFFETLGKKISRGEEIKEFEDVNSLGLSGVVNVSEGVKSKSSIDSGEIKRFPVNPNTKVEEDVPLEQFNGKKVNLMESDRMIGGYISDSEGNPLFKFYGGVFYPVITGKWWASRNKVKAKGIAENANKNRDKDGYIYSAPMIGSDKQHMSNTDMLTVTVELMKFDANSKASKVKKSDVISYIDKAFSNKSVQGKKAVVKTVLKKSNNINELFNELEFVLFQEGDKILDKNGNPILDENKKPISNFTFEERLAIVNSILGDPKVKEARFPSAGSISDAAKRFEEPVTAKANKIGDLVTIMRTKGTLKYKTSEVNDDFYHKSYPEEIYAVNEDDSPAEIEVYVLEGAYSMNDVLPSLTQSSGKEFTWEEYLEKHKSENLAIAQYNRTAKLSSASGEIKVGVKTKAQFDDDVKSVFEENSELASIGTAQQYAEYLDEVFPERQLKDIFYRGTPDPNMIEAEDIDPKKGTGAKNLGIGIYWTLDKKKSADYTNGGKGRVMAAILDIKNFHVVDINTNARRGYANPKDLTVSEATNGADAIISYDGLDKKNYVDFKTDGTNTTYIGEYIGPVDENGLPTYQKDNEITPKMTELAVDSNEQVHILGSEKDKKEFQNFVNNQRKNVSIEINGVDVTDTFNRLGIPIMSLRQSLAKEGNTLQSSDQLFKGIRKDLLYAIDSGIEYWQKEVDKQSSKIKSSESDFGFREKMLSKYSNVVSELNEIKKLIEEDLLLRSDVKITTNKGKGGVVAKAQMDDVQRTAQMYNMNDQGFFPKNADEFKINKDFERFGLKAKRANPSSYGPGSLYLVNQAGRKINPFNRPKGKSQLSDEESTIARNIAGDAVSIAEVTGVKKAEAIKQAVLDLMEGNQAEADKFLNQYPDMMKGINNAFNNINRKKELQRQEDAGDVTVNERRALLDQVKIGIQNALQGKKEGVEEGKEKGFREGQKEGGKFGSFVGFFKGLAAGRTEQRGLGRLVSDYIKDAVENGLGKKGYISPAMLKSISRRAATISNQKQLDAFVNYLDTILANKLVADAVESIEKAKKKARGVKGYQYTAMMKHFASFDLFNSDGDLVFDYQTLEQYKTALDKLNNRTPDVSGMYEMSSNGVDSLFDFMAEINEQNQPKPKDISSSLSAWQTASNDLFNNAKNIIVKNNGVVDVAASIANYRAFKKNVNKFVKALDELLAAGMISEFDYEREFAAVKQKEEVYNTYAEDFQDEINEIKQTIVNDLLDKNLQDQIKDWVDNTAVLTPTQKQLAKQLLRANDGNLMTLSLDDLDVLNEAVTQFAENGFVDEKNIRTILDRAEIRGQNIGGKLNKQLEKVKQKFRGPDAKENLKYQLLRKATVFWESLIGLKENGIYRKYVADPINQAFSGWSSGVNDILSKYVDVVNDLKLKGSRKVWDRAKGKDRKISNASYTRIKIGVIGHILDNAWTAKMDKKPAKDWLKKLVEDYQSQNDMAMRSIDELYVVQDVYNRLLEKFSDADGNLDHAAVLQAFESGDLDVMDDTERKYYSAAQNALSEAGEYINSANSMRDKGGEINPYYMPRQYVGSNDASNSTDVNYHKNLGQAIRSGASHQRLLPTPNRALNFNVDSLVFSNVNEGLRDFYLTDAKRYVNEVFRNARENMTDEAFEGNLLRSLQELSKGTVDFGVSEQDGKPNGLMTKINTLFFTTALIGSVRTPVEFFNNVIGYSIGKRSLKSLTLPFKGKEKQETENLLKEFNSSVRFDVPTRNISLKKERVLSGDTLVDMKTKKDSQISMIVPWLNNLSAFMRKGEWKSQFDRAFERATGEKFDYNKHYVNGTTEDYVAMKQAASDADFMARRIMRGGSKAERRQFIQMFPRKKAMISANSVTAPYLSLLTDFISHDVTNMGRGITKVVEGEIKDGMTQTLGGLFRLSLYPFLMSITKNVMKMYTGDDDEKEEAKEDLATLSTSDGWIDMGLYVAEQLASSTISGKYGTFGKIGGIAFLDAMYNLTDDPKHKTFIKDMLKEIYFVQPYDIKKRDDKAIALQVMNAFLPMVGTLTRNGLDLIDDAMDRGKEQATMYDLVEVFTNTPEGKEWLIAANLVVQAAQITTLLLTKQALPFVDDFASYVEDNVANSRVKEINPETRYTAPNGQVIDLTDMLLDDNEMLLTTVEGSSPESNQALTQRATEIFNGKLKEFKRFGSEDLPADQIITYKLLKEIAAQSKNQAKVEMGGNETPITLINVERDKVRDEIVGKNELIKDLMSGKHYTRRQSSRFKANELQYISKQIEGPMKGVYEKATELGKTGITEYLKSLHRAEYYKLEDKPVQEDYFIIQDGKAVQTPKIID
jgi:hypothetical protein